MAIEREVDDTRNIRDAGVKDKRRVNLLLLAQGRSRRFLLHKDIRDRAAANHARADNLRMADLLGLTASQGRGHVSIAISLDA